MHAFKSPRHVVSAFLLKSREALSQQIQKLKDENERLKSQLEQQERLAAEQQKQIDSMKQLCDELGQQCDLATQSVNLPHDQPIGTHGYGVRMITVAVNLARAVGLRGAHRVLKFFLNGSVFVKRLRREHRFETGFSGWELGE